MRISDWSSDVCSSDLCNAHCDHRLGFGTTVSIPPSAPRARKPLICFSTAPKSAYLTRSLHVSATILSNGLSSFPHTGIPSWKALRSEEHTSELQSLMRISYAVFCLKQKKT